MKSNTARKKALIMTELEKLGEEDLQKVYALIVRFKELRQLGQEGLIAITRPQTSREVSI